MSARKPMGCFWAILAVRDEVLSGGRRILLSKMYLLDNGSRGCTAKAAFLGQCTGLTERTVDKYRRELDALGLLYHVTGTHGWHANLPTGVPPDRATGDEIRTYARRIEAQIRAGETTPAGVPNHTPERGENGPTKPPGGVDSVAKERTTDPAGLVSTQETQETALTSALLRKRNGTQEQGQASQDGEEIDTSSLDAKRRAWRDAAKQIGASKRSPTPAAPETAK